MNKALEVWYKEAIIVNDIIQCNTPDSNRVEQDMLLSLIASDPKSTWSSNDEECYLVFRFDTLQSLFARDDVQKHLYEILNQYTKRLKVW
jgi:hypothetical protein